MVALLRVLHVTMGGYAASTVEGVEKSKTHQITACLRRQRQDGAGPGGASSGGSIAGPPRRAGACRPVVPYTTTHMARIEPSHLTLSHHSIIRASGPNGPIVQWSSPPATLDSTTKSAPVRPGSAGGHRPPANAWHRRGGGLQAYPEGWSSPPRHAAGRRGQACDGHRCRR